MDVPQETKAPEQFILFYSDRCGQSKKFMDLLQEFPAINACFQKMDVVSLHNMGRLPPQLTHTPGVIDGNKLLMGPNAFKWLEDKSKEIISSGPQLNPKGGFYDSGFSFIESGSDEFSPYHSNFENGDPNNGSNIDPSKFDQKDGTPKTQQPQQQQSDSGLPPQLQPISVTNDNGKLSESDMQRYMSNRDVGIEIRR